MRRRFPLWAVIGTACLLALGLFGTREDTAEVCRSCLARRDTTKFPAWTTEDLRGSAVLDETYGGSHEHRWEFNNSQEYVFGLIWRRGCGDPLGNPVPMTYRDDVGFRTLVRARLADGSLRREDWQALCEVPSHAWRWPEDRRAEYRARVRQALALVRESGRGDTSTYPFYWWTREIEEAAGVRK